MPPSTTTVRKAGATMFSSCEIKCLQISVLDTPDCKPNRCGLGFCLRQQRNGCRACTVRPEVVNSGSCAFFIAKALLTYTPSPQLAMQWVRAKFESSGDLSALGDDYLGSLLEIVSSCEASNGHSTSPIQMSERSQALTATPTL